VTRHEIKSIEGRTISCYTTRAVQNDRHTYVTQKCSVTVLQCASLPVKVTSQNSDLLIIFANTETRGFTNEVFKSRSSGL